MPIGVPRIIYCWGEEVPAQWTDIYNFIFRRRMVFLMQYLDDELCNQICGLLINIHMEDRGKELEKREMEKSGLFKSGVSKTSSSLTSKNLSQNSDVNQSGASSFQGSSRAFSNPQKLIEDLLISEQDLGIEENDSLERYTLQKMTLEWLNWNSPFFDYSEEPYLFYLAEILAKDFENPLSSPSDKEEGIDVDKNFQTSNKEGQLYYDQTTSNKIDTLESEAISSTSSYVKKTALHQTALSDKIKDGGHFEFTKLMKMFKSMNPSTNMDQVIDREIKHFDVYSPFRLLSNLVSLDYRDFKFNNVKKTGISKSENRNTQTSKDQMSEKFKVFQKYQKAEHVLSITSPLPKGKEGDGFREAKGNAKSNINVANSTLPISDFISHLAQKNLFEELDQPNSKIMLSEKAFAQNKLRREYKKTPRLSTKPSSYLTKSATAQLSNSTNLEDRAEFRDYYRKQGVASQALSEEEAKKVFMIINSFGGSVGNGITVHDALQFIKAGTLTLGLGVAASAASLALAGGTIGERYVTEGCHTMLHQPEGSLSGQASDIWIDSQEIMKIRLDVAEIYSLATYRPRHKILRDLDRDFYLTAGETIAYGLADEIATNEVMHEIISMTSQVWDYHDNQQQRLLESRESVNAAADTQNQN